MASVSKIYGLPPDRMKYSTSARAKSVLPVRPCSEATIPAWLAPGMAAWSGRLGCHASIRESVDEADTIVLAGSLIHPASHISPQDKRIIRSLAVCIPVGNESRERNPGEFGLFEGHLIELRDGHLDRVHRQFEISFVELRIPLEKAGFIDEILHQQIFAPGSIGPDLANFLERGDRGANNVEQNEIELTGIDEIEKSDLGERLQRIRQ